MCVQPRRVVAGRARAHVQVVHRASAAVRIVALVVRRVARRFALCVVNVAVALPKRVFHAVRKVIPASAAITRRPDHTIDRVVAGVVDCAVQNRRAAAQTVVVHLTQRFVLRIKSVAHLLKDCLVGVAAIRPVFHLACKRTKLRFRALRALFCVEKRLKPVGRVLRTR